jgi:hypothetical protein
MPAGNARNQPGLIHVEAPRVPLPPCVWILASAGMTEKKDVATPAVQRAAISSARGVIVISPFSITMRPRRAISVWPSSV